MVRWLSLSSVALLLFSCADSGAIETCANSTECTSLADQCVDGQCKPVARDAGRDVPSRDTASADTARDVPADVALDAGSDSNPDSVGPDVPSTCASGACNAFRYDTDTGWTQIPLSPDGAFAPEAPVVCAFDAESTGRAYLLTATTYHILNLADGAFVAGGPRADLFPETAGLALSFAYSNPTRRGLVAQDSVILSSPARAVIYDLNRTTGAFTYTREVTEFGEAWSSPMAPSRGEIRAAWLAPDNGAGWVSGSPSATCGHVDTEFSVYLAFLTATNVHFFDRAHCAEFVEVESNTVFAPFRERNAPDPSNVSGSFFHDGDLWMVTP